MSLIVKLFTGLDWVLLFYGGGSATGFAFFRKRDKLYRVEVIEADEEDLRHAKHSGG